MNKENKHLVDVLVEGANISLFIDYLIKNKKEFFNLKKINNTRLIIKVKKELLDELIKLNLTYDYKIIKESGVYFLISFFKKKWFLFLAFSLVMINVFVLSNLIVKVNIIHSKASIRELIFNELENYGIKEPFFKKKYENLQKIKKEILKKYPTKLEWLELEVQGMTLNVRVAERIINEDKQKKEACHVVAKKDAIITKITASNGEIKKEKTNYVTRGDVIISGIITLFDTPKGTTCASGQVLGESWYQINVSVPLILEIKEETGKIQTNFIFKTQTKEYLLLRPKYEKTVTTKKEIFSLFDIKFFQAKQKEVRTKSKILNEEEGIKEALAMVEKKLLLKDKKGRIINYKIIKKDNKNGKLNLEIFLVVEEIISEQQEFISEEITE